METLKTYIKNQTLIVPVPETTTPEIVDPPIPEIQLIDETTQECKFLISCVGMDISEDLSGNS